MVWCLKAIERAVCIGASLLTLRLGSSISDCCQLLSGSVRYPGKNITFQRFADTAEGADKATTHAHAHTQHEAEETIQNKAVKRQREGMRVCVCKFERKGEKTRDRARLR